MKNKRQIAIIGSGISGFAAAIAASSKDTEVRVFDYSSKPGGQATHVNVGTICGLFKEEKLINHPFLIDFVENYLAFDQSAKVINHAGYNVLSYDWKQFQLYIENEFATHGITFLGNHELNKIQTEQRKITFLETRSAEKTAVYPIDSIVDCTGKAVVSELLNASTIHSEKYQAPAYIFEMENVVGVNEFALNMVLSRFCQKNDCPPLFVVPGSFKEGKLALKLALKISGTDDQALMSNVLTETKNFVTKELIPQLSTQTDAFKKAKLIHLFSELGIRTSKRSQGKYTLTFEDLITPKQIQDVVAIGSWPMEEWSESGKVEMTVLKQGVYAIPSGCLQSAEYENLFFGGKTISADEKAISSARVMGTCLQTGYAAGRMAMAENENELTKIIQQISQSIG